MRSHNKKEFTRSLVLWFVSMINFQSDEKVWNWKEILNSKLFGDLNDEFFMAMVLLLIHRQFHDILLTKDNFHIIHISYIIFNSFRKKRVVFSFNANIALKKIRSINLKVNFTLISYDSWKLSFSMEDKSWNNPSTFR